jgi:hypothetical protein
MAGQWSMLDRNAARSATTIMMTNPCVTSGYRFNDVGMHVEYIVEALRPFSEPSRVTRFKTCLCYYDGKIEFFEYGMVDCDMVFCNSLRTVCCCVVCVCEYRLSVVTSFLF